MISIQALMAAKELQPRDTLLFAATCAAHDPPVHVGTIRPGANSSKHLHPKMIHKSMSKWPGWTLHPFSDYYSHHDTLQIIKPASSSGSGAFSAGVH